jgi:cobaltochelatase CobN
VRQKLAKEYAMSVIKKRVACCDHTCNNPMLNQMVVSILSLPGIMSPELIEQFKMAIEQAAQVDLDSQVEARTKLVDQLAGTTAPDDKSLPQPGQENRSKEEGATDVKGYKMKKNKKKDDTTQATSSGVEWFAGLLMMAILGLGFLRTRKKLKEQQCIDMDT